MTNYAAEAATGKFGHLSTTQLVFLYIAEPSHDEKKSHIAHLLPAPALPSLRLHIIVLSGGCGGYNGTVQCWCCRGPLPSDISWLPHFKGNTPQTRTYNHLTNKRRHALNLFIASLKHLYGFCFWEQPLHPGSSFMHVIATQWGQYCKYPWVMSRLLLHSSTACHNTTTCSARSVTVSKPTLLLSHLRRRGSSPPGREKQNRIQ